MAAPAIQGMLDHLLPVRARLRGAALGLTAGQSRTTILTLPGWLSPGSGGQTLLVKFLQAVEGPETGTSSCPGRVPGGA